MQVIVRNLSVTAISLSTMLLVGCGGFNVWPFGDSEKVMLDATKPVNSTEYLCESNKKFYVRNIDKSDSAWLILADREVGLPKVSGTRYSNGITTFDINGTDATLEINPTTTYKGCKASPGKP